MTATTPAYPRWRKSSHSGGVNSDCAEVGQDGPDGVQMRDSKDPDGPVLMLDTAAWGAFLAMVKSA